MLLSFCTDERNPSRQTGNIFTNPAQPNTTPPGYNESQDYRAKNLLRYADDCIILF